MQTGFFERRAIESRDRRIRKQTEFSEEDIAPIRITHMSLTRLGDLTRSQFDETLADHGTIFLCDGRNKAPRIHAMVTPVAFDYLLQVSKVLKDDRRFTLAPGEREKILEEIGQQDSQQQPGKN